MEQGLTKIDGGVFQLGGPLTKASVGNLQRDGQRQFAATAGSVEVDLSAVTVADSAGLALLIDWLAWSAERKRALSYRNVPDALLALAEISEVRDLLLPPGPIQDRPA